MKEGSGEAIRQPAPASRRVEGTMRPHRVLHAVPQPADIERLLAEREARSARIDALRVDRRLVPDARNLQPIPPEAEDVEQRLRIRRALDTDSRLETLRKLVKV